VAADFNGDGLTDLFVANNGSGSVALLLGGDLGPTLGDLQFASPVERPSDLALVELGGLASVYVAGEGHEVAVLLTSFSLGLVPGLPGDSPIPAGNVEGSVPRFNLDLPDPPAHDPGAVEAVDEPEVLTPPAAPRPPLTGLTSVADRFELSRNEEEPPAAPGAVDPPVLPGMDFQESLEWELRDFHDRVLDLPGGGRAEIEPEGAGGQGAVRDALNGLIGLLPFPDGTLPDLGEVLGPAFADGVSSLPGAGAVSVAVESLFGPSPVRLGAVMSPWARGPWPQYPATRSGIGSGRVWRTVPTTPALPRRGARTPRGTCPRGESRLPPCGLVGR